MLIILHVNIEKKFTISKEKIYSLRMIYLQRYKTLHEISASSRLRKIITCQYFEKIVSVEKDYTLNINYFQRYKA